MQAVKFLVIHCEIERQFTHNLLYFFLSVVEKKTYRRESDDGARRNTNPDFRFKVLPFVSKFLG